uniref:Uncharacterized protein n=1 Tax=Arundo donax TaxID=35708 RepID=A0A0A9GF04_ARUDO
MEIEYQVKLTDIAKIMIQYLNKVMDDLKSLQFVISGINAHAEVKACISLIHNSVPLPVYKIAQLGAPCQHQITYFFDDLCSLLLRIWSVPFCQPHLPLPADEKHKMYLTTKQKC